MLFLLSYTGITLRVLFVAGHMALNQNILKTSSLSLSISYNCTVVVGFCLDTLSLLSISNLAGPHVRAGNVVADIDYIQDAGYGYVLQERKVHVGVPEMS